MAQAETDIFSGLAKFLESRPEVKDVKLTSGQPATTSETSSWERAQLCALPEDARNFYLSSNGVSLCWSYQYNDTLLQLGEINVNPLAKLRPLHVERGTLSQDVPSLLDLDQGNSLGVPWKPSFCGGCKIFALDYNPTCGHICLVYNSETESDAYSVWLLDLSLQWFYLCPSFTDYLRLAVVHLGLLQWPYAFTPYGVSPQYEKWFHMFIPKRLELDFTHMSRQQQQQQQHEDPQGHSDHTHNLLLTSCMAKQDVGSEMHRQQFVNHFDPSKILLPKSLKDKRSKVNSTPAIKKQPTTTTK